MILGIDKGTTYTKVSTGTKLKSTIRVYDPTEINLNDKKVVTIEGLGSYFIGEGIRTVTDAKKGSHDNTLPLILTAIAENIKTKDREAVDIVIGLPISEYTREKESIKKLFDLFHNYKVTINNKHYIRKSN